MEYTFEGGDIISNYAAVALVNNTAKTETVTVTSNQRWMIYAGHIMNGDDVGRDCRVYIDNGTNELYRLLLDNCGASGGYSFFPNSEALGANSCGNPRYPIPVIAGWRIVFYYAAGGASAGGSGSRAVIARVVNDTD